MKKLYKAVIPIALLGLLSGLCSGCSSIKSLLVGNVKDGDGMVNYNGYFLEMYDGDWASADGRYAVTMDGNELWLSVDGEQVLSAGFDIYAESDDTNAHNVIYLNDNTINGDTAIDELYSENGTLYMLVSHTDGTSETVALEKKAAEEA